MPALSSFRYLRVTARSVDAFDGLLLTTQRYFPMGSPVADTRHGAD
jgi:hypothetical protein